MKKFIYTIVGLFVFMPLIGFAQENQAENNLVQGKKQAVYFYSESCSHCQKVDAFFKEKGFYDKYDITKLSIDKKVNQELLGKVFADKEYKTGGVPTIIIDEDVITGDAPIITKFESKIEKSQGTATLYVDSFRKKKSSTGAISMTVLISAALVDAINPCAFAVLILLIATVLKAKGKRNAFQSGLLFSLAIFISYILMGLGVYKAITIFNFPKIISMVVGGVAIIIGLANLKDFFWYGKVFIMEVPLSWRPNMGKILRGVTSPFGAFTAGLLVSLFLLPCTSGPYVVILGLLAEKVEFAKAFSLLVLYNLIFIAPMILITVAVSYFGVKAGKLEDWRKKNLKLLHLIAGVIMVAIGIYLIQGWL